MIKNKNKKVKATQVAPKTSSQDPRALLGDDPKFLDRSHKLNPGLSSHHPCIATLVNAIADNIGLTGTGRVAQRQKETLKNILCSLLKAEEYKGCVGISRNANDYNAHSRYRQLFFTYIGVKSITDKLEKFNYVYKKKGVRRKRVSRYWASRKLLSAYHQILSGSISSSRVQFYAATPKCAIQLKDGNKKLIDYPYDTYTQNLETAVNRINASNFNHLQGGVEVTFQNYTDYYVFIRDIHHIGINVADWSISPIDHRYTITNGLTNAFYWVKLSADNFNLYRVFNNGTFQDNGRHYARFQQISSKFRKAFCLGGVSVVELDYSCLHTSMLYHRVGATLPPNPYIQPKGYVLRDLNKLLLNAIYNSKSWNSCIQLLLKKELHRDKYKQIHSYLKGLNKNPHYHLKVAYNKITQLHSSISCFFHSKVGSELQNVDSEIAAEVMLHFVNKDVPILPVHDSFIVPACNKNELEQVMKQKYEEVMKRRYSLQGTLHIDVK